MRLLLKKIHPDRFTGHPDAQKVNESSLKLLLAYLQELRGSGGQPGYIYNFEFHLMGVPERTASEIANDGVNAKDWLQWDPRNWDVTGVSEASPAGTINPAAVAFQRPDKDVALSERAAQHDAGREMDGAGGDALTKVSLRLPSPGPGNGERLPRSVRGALGRLFSACGLPNIYLDDGDLTSGLDSSQLRYFLPEAVELARRGEAALYGLPAQQVQAMRAAFSFGRKVRVVFDAEVERLPAGKHVILLEALAKAFDKASTADVRNCTLVLGEGRGVDNCGRLWLRYDDNPDAWCRTLQTADLGAVQERKLLMQRVRQTEDGVAKALGVDCLFTSAGFALSGAYMDFLQRVTVTAHSIGPILAGQLRGVSLCVMPPAELPQMDHDANTGVVRVNSLVHVLDLYDYVADRAPEIMRCGAAAAAVEAELKSLMCTVESRLRLRSLQRDRSLAAADFKSGCYRLLRFQQTLLPHTEGCRLRVTHQNGIRPGDTSIDIAWNFEV